MHAKVCPKYSIIREYFKAIFFGGIWYFRCFSSISNVREASPCIGPHDLPSSYNLTSTSLVGGDFKADIQSKSIKSRSKLSPPPSLPSDLPPPFTPCTYTVQDINQGKSNGFNEAFKKA